MIKPAGSPLRGVNHVIKNCKFIPSWPSEKSYRRNFIEVFPAARVKSAKVGDIQALKARIRKTSGKCSEIDVQKKLCFSIADKLSEKIDEIKDKEAVIIHEQDSHEFALPFLLALNKVFGAKFKVLCLDRHLDAQANEFEYMSFWKFAIANSLIDARDLMILGPHQLLWAKEFISYFKEKDIERFETGLLDLMPKFEDTILFVNRSDKFRREINGYIDVRLPKDMPWEERARISSSMMVYETNEFAFCLRSFWEAEGLKRKGVSLIPPQGFEKKDKGSDADFGKKLQAIRTFASGSALMVSFDIDVKLHPERLFAVAEAVSGAGASRIALNIAGLNSRGSYPDGADNNEIKEFIRIIRGR